MSKKPTFETIHIVYALAFFVTLLIGFGLLIKLFY